MVYSEFGAKKESNDENVTNGKVIIFQFNIQLKF